MDIVEAQLLASEDLDMNYYVRRDLASGVHSCGVFI